MLWGVLCPGEIDSSAGAAETVGVDSRISQTPIVDKGFAAVRKIGNGLYATISNPTKGNTTLCNGALLWGAIAH